MYFLSKLQFNFTIDKSGYAEFNNIHNQRGFISSKVELKATATSLGLYTKDAVSNGEVLFDIKLESCLRFVISLVVLPILFVKNEITGTKRLLNFKRCHGEQVAYGRHIIKIKNDS